MAGDLGETNMGIFCRGLQHAVILQRGDRRWIENDCRIANPR